MKWKYLGNHTNLYVYNLSANSSYVRLFVDSWRSVCLQLVSAVIIIHCNQLYLGRSWMLDRLRVTRSDQHSQCSLHTWSHETMPCIIAIIEFCQYWILIAIKVTGFPQSYAVHAFQAERCEKLQMPNWKQHQSSRKFWNLLSVNDQTTTTLPTLPPSRHKSILVVNEWSFFWWRGWRKILNLFLFS